MTRHEGFDFDEGSVFSLCDICTKILIPQPTGVPFSVMRLTVYQLEHSPYCLGNLTYREYNSLPASLTKLAGWFERMRTFQYEPSAEN